MKRNYFENGFDSERYVTARPYIHGTAISEFSKRYVPGVVFKNVLDIACGTGQSSIAVAEIAERVLGIDASGDMLANAISHPKVNYRFGRAEATELPSKKFDLITVAQAFHWFDREKFLTEASRLLVDQGHLLIYTSFFSGEMKGEPEFLNWFKEGFLKKYPSPPRDRAPLTEELAQAYGLALLGEADFEDNIEMSSSRFRDYEISTSNVVAAMDRGDSLEDISDWIDAGIATFFTENKSCSFIFRGKLSLLQKGMV